MNYKTYCVQPIVTNVAFNDQMPFTINLVLLSSDFLSWIEEVEHSFFKGLHVSQTKNACFEPFVCNVQRGLELNLFMYS